MFRPTEQLLGSTSGETSCSGYTCIRLQIIRIHSFKIARISGTSTGSSKRHTDLRPRRSWICCPNLVNRSPSGGMRWWRGVLCYPPWDRAGEAFGVAQTRAASRCRGGNPGGLVPGPVSGEHVAGAAGVGPATCVSRPALQRPARGLCCTCESIIVSPRCWTCSSLCLAPRGQLPNGRDFLPRIIAQASGSLMLTT